MAFALYTVTWLILLEATPGRPPVDKQAMEEAILASQGHEESLFSSSSSYAHFLRSQLAANVGDNRRAVDELRLALASSPDNPFLLTKLAQEYARAGKGPQAERELKKVLEKKTGYYPAQLLLGRVLLDSKKYQRARTHLEKAILLSPQSVEPYLALAQLFLNEERVSEAVKIIERLGRALPGEPLGYKKLGLAVAERGDFQISRSLLTRAVERDPGDFHALMALGHVDELLEDWPGAEKAYDQALVSEQDSTEALLAAGRVALRQKQAEKARGFFDRLMSLSQDSELAVKVAFSFWAVNQLEEAAQVMDSARAAGLREPRLHFYAGLIYEQMGQYERALSAFSQIESTSRDVFFEARLHRAVCHSQLKNHEEALVLFQRGLSERPDSESVVTLYARALERAGKAGEAEKLLRASLEKTPRPEWYEALLGLWGRQGRVAESVVMLKEALRVQPENEELLLMLSTAYETQGEVSSALATMRQVLKVNPDNALAMNYIGYTLANQGQGLEEAERLLLRALQLKPDNASFIDSLGWLYFRAGKYEKAVRYLERAASLLPQDPTVLEHLGDVYSRMGRLTEAEEAYGRALGGLEASPELAESPEQTGNIERKRKNLFSEAKPR